MREFPRLVLHPRRDRPIRNRHPWVFSGAVAQASPELPAGAIVDIYDAQGNWLARAAYHPQAELCARVLTWDPSEIPDTTWLRQRIAASLERRHFDRLPPTAARRLVFSEADGLPGLIVDRYGEYLVVSLLTAFWEQRRELLTEVLVEQVQPKGIFERSDGETRAREGLPPAIGPLYGPEPPELVPFEEAGCRFLADVRAGQKTGFYLDQRENRARIAQLASGARMLNVFSYTGAFGIVALTHGADSVLNIEASQDAAALGDRHAEENGVQNRWETIVGDAFQELRRLRNDGERFDLVVLDPPKFASTKHHLERACRGYKDLNLLAIQLLRPGGILATFSCTGLVDPKLFRQVVAAAAMDSKREVRLLEKRTQPDDHPILMTFPESEYLKGLILRVD
ncbi:MAG: 23S rRNA methyltransferase [Candidatus Poribacteria bacterium]|nr:MAG: 23S rRNA methyltransferase [Candidatus Poribacteria bacterium]